MASAITTSIVSGQKAEKLTQSAVMQPNGREGKAVVSHGNVGALGTLGSVAACCHRWLRLPLAVGLCSWGVILVQAGNRAHGSATTTVCRALSTEMALVARRPEHNLAETHHSHRASLTAAYVPAAQKYQAFTPSTAKSLVVLANCVGSTESATVSSHVEVLGAPAETAHSNDPVLCTASCGIPKPL